MDVDAISSTESYLRDNGFAYNKYITINLDWCGVKHPQKFISKLLNRMQKWHKRKNMTFSYLWVLESVPIVGVHIHLLIHTDYDRFYLLDDMMTRWFDFERDDRLGQKNTNVSIKDIYDHEGLISYLCKGLRVNIEHEAVHTKKGRGDQGRIYGRRWGMSQNKI